MAAGDTHHRFEDTTLADAVKRGNPVVFFDVTIGSRAAGRIKMELFKDIVPRVRRVASPEPPKSPPRAASKAPRGERGFERSRQEMV